MHIEQTIEEMRAAAELLADYSFPLSTREDEDEISLLKNREVVLDGYEVVLNYGVADYGEFRLEIFQCMGKVTPFLPFFLVSKLARKFLGRERLAFLDVMLTDKKVYCWMVGRDGDEPIDTGQRVVGEIDFEGFRFAYLDRDSVNLF